jgi:hypothetical protein
MEDNKPKEIQIEKIRFDVENITDGLGMPIDKGIKETVIYILAMGFRTTQSCEGHFIDEEGEEHPDAPFVEIYPEEPEQEDWTDIPELRDKVSEETVLYKEKAEALLEKFYEENPDSDNDARLHLWQIGYGWRFEPVSTDKLSTLKGAEAEELLKKQQAEMKRFTDFLKEKFFSS